MRALILASAALVATLVPGAAGARECGDDVDGRAVACACGDVLVGSRTLGDDDPVTREPCPGPGLEVRADRRGSAPTLALGGHTITGSGHGAGVHVVVGAGLVLRGPGTIRGFDVGVLAPRGGVAAVSDLLVVDNVTDGARVAGVGYAVTGCEAAHNGRDGFVLAGRDYRLDGNRAHENGRRGFALAGAPSTVAAAGGNAGNDNGRSGMRVRGRGRAAGRAWR